MIGTSVVHNWQYNIIQQQYKYRTLAEDPRSIELVSILVSLLQNNKRTFISFQGSINLPLLC